MTRLLSLLLRWRFSRPDPAAQMQTPIQKYSGYDQDKARAGWKRSQEHSETGRKLTRPQAAEVVDIRERRKA